MASPIRATVLHCPGHGHDEELAKRLNREVIDTFELHSPTLPPETPPPAPVTLVVIPTRLTAPQLKALVAWGASVNPPTGLIGAAPAGIGGDGEAALAAGFDDFVVGDVSIRELAARIRALHRRIHQAAQRDRDLRRYGEFSLDPAQQELWVGGRRVLLTRTEASVMQALIGARGRALHRRELLDAGWGDQNFEVGERAVDNVILRLRRKLGDRRSIITVRGVGFRIDDAG